MGYRITAVNILPLEQTYYTPTIKGARSQLLPQIGIQISFFFAFN